MSLFHQVTSRLKIPFSYRTHNFFSSTRSQTPSQNPPTHSSVSTQTQLQQSSTVTTVFHRRYNFLMAVRTFHTIRTVTVLQLLHTSLLYKDTSHDILRRYNILRYHNLLHKGNTLPIQSRGSQSLQSSHSHAIFQILQVIHSCTRQMQIP